MLKKRIKIGILVSMACGIFLPQTTEAWYLSSYVTGTGTNNYSDDGYVGQTISLATNGFGTEVYATCYTWDDPDWSGTGRPAQTTNAQITATVYRSVSVQGSPSPGPSSTVTYSYTCGQQHVETTGDESNPSEPGTSGIVTGRAAALSEFIAENSSTTYEWIAYSKASISLDENPAIAETYRTDSYYGPPPMVVNWSTGSFTPGATPYEAHVHYNGFAGATAASAQGFYAALSLQATAKAWYDYDAQDAESTASDPSYFTVAIGIP